RARQLHHHARHLVVPRHGGPRRGLAARLDRGLGLHHLRAQHRRRHLQGPVRRRVRRVAVPRHLPDAAWRAADGDARPALDRQAQEVASHSRDAPRLCGAFRIGFSPRQGQQHRGFNAGSVQQFSFPDSSPQNEESCKTPHREPIMLRRQKLRIAAFATAVIAFAAAGGSALAQKKYDTGATDTEIKLGNIMPYSGPASAYGVIGKIEDAYFKMINEQGGINGRKINFISYDDSYSPPKAVEQARKLVESDEVLFLFGPLGTPPNSATVRTFPGPWAGSRPTRARGGSTPNIS